MGMDEMVAHYGCEFPGSRRRIANAAVRALDGVTAVTAKTTACSRWAAKVLVGFRV